MSKSFRREVAKKLKEQIEAATDPIVIANLANVLAKYLPKPKPPRRRGGTPAPIKSKDTTFDDMVAALEKKRRGLELTETETQMVAAVEEKRKERAVLNGASAEIA